MTPAAANPWDADPIAKPAAPQAAVMPWDADPIAKAATPAPASKAPETMDLLPFSVGNKPEERSWLGRNVLGRILPGDTTDFAVPKMVTEALQVAALPGKTMQGYRATPEDALNFATLGIGGGVASGGGRVLESAIGNDLERAAALNAGGKQALDAGFVLPPEMAKVEPGLIARSLSGLGGKTKLGQSASVKNAELVKQMTARELGLPDDTVLSHDVLDQIRSDAGQSYADVSKALPTVTPDDAFRGHAQDLAGVDSGVREYFPDLVKNDEIQTLQDTLGKMGSVPTKTAMELIKQLRADAKGNLYGPTTPKQKALGLAQRRGAAAIENLIGRNIGAKDELVEAPPLPTSAEPVAGELPLEATGTDAVAADRRTRGPLVDVPNKNAKSFLSWVMGNGGIKDTDGEIAAAYRDAGKTPPPGLIANVNGTPLDKMAREAQQAGYLKQSLAGSEQGGLDELTGDHVLDLVKSHLEGKPVYSELDRPSLEAHDAANAANDEIKRLAAQHDIDYRGMTADQFHNTVKERADLLDKADDLGLSLEGKESPAQILAMIAEHIGQMGKVDPDALDAMIDRRFGNGLPEFRDELPWTDDAAHAQAKANSQPGSAPEAGSVAEKPQNVGGAETGIAVADQSGAGSAASPVPGANTGASPDLIKAFRDARTRIAKTYDIEKALNPATGEIDAAVLGRMLKSRKPLTGELRTIAEAALAYPKAMQMPSRFGGASQSSPLDWFGALLTGTHAVSQPSKGAAVLGALVGRPVARGILLSPAYQRSMRNEAAIRAQPRGTIGGMAATKKGQ